MPDNDTFERDYLGVILSVKEPSVLPPEVQVLDVESTDTEAIQVHKIDIIVGDERPDVYLRVDDPFHEIYLSALQTMVEQARLVYFAVGRRGLVTSWTPAVVGRTLQTNQDGKGNFIVELDSSARRFVLLPNHAKYEQVRAFFVKAHNDRIVVAIACDSNGTDIISAKEATGLPYTTLPACVPKTYDDDAANISRVTAGQAADCWDAVAALQCCTKVNDPCVPFLFFDDGCHMRAELMCRALAALNPAYRAGKVWIRGDLQLEVRDPSKRTAGWFWHVAVFVIPKGATSKWDFLVLDPMVATEAVTIREWGQLLGDGGARWTLTSQEAYLGVYELDANNDVVESGGRCQGNGVATHARESDDDLRFFQKLLLLRWPTPAYPC